GSLFQSLCAKNGFCPAGASGCGVVDVCRPGAGVVEVRVKATRPIASTAAERTYLMGHPFASRVTGEVTTLIKASCWSIHTRKLPDGGARPGASHRRGRGLRRPPVADRHPAIPPGDESPGFAHRATLPPDSASPGQIPRVRPPQEECERDRRRTCPAA